MNVPEAILRVLEGDTDAFSVILEKHHVAIRNMVAVTFPHADRVSELAQEIFVRAYFQLSTYDLERPFWFWLRGIAKNVIREALREAARRAKQREALAEVALLGQAERALDMTLTREGEQNQLDALRDCMQQLPSRNRQLVELFHKERLTSREIAAKLGRGASAIRNALIRARLALRKCVDRRVAPELS